MKVEDLVRVAVAAALAGQWSSCDYLMAEAKNVALEQKRVKEGAK